MSIFFYNSLTKQKQLFEPLQTGKVSMYVCGPTVYDYPHVGNARAVVVYDVLYRLLNYTYGQENITYVRNITDVDDKINKAAIDNNVAIQDITKKFTDIFHQDMQALNCLPPTIEPRAVDNIEHMIVIIEKLIVDNHAYERDGEVFFSINSYSEYGKLSGRSIDELTAGARVEVSENKIHPGDFVLWKPASSKDDASSVFLSPWGPGRPGWHIECSAMSMRYLGADFDIHGGGADLMFPHHENEIAQSCSYKAGSKFARFWLHNGFVTVNGEKMSKSLKNFVTPRQLLDQGIKGEAIRYLLMSTHYRKPLDFTDKALEDAKKSLDSFYRVLQEQNNVNNGKVAPEIIAALADDLNTPDAFSVLHNMVKNINKENDVPIKADLIADFKASANFLGIIYEEYDCWFNIDTNDEQINRLVHEREIAKRERNFELADQIRDQLKAQNIFLEDKASGTSWHRK